MFAQQRGFLTPFLSGIFSSDAILLRMFCASANVLRMTTQTPAVVSPAEQHLSEIPDGPMSIRAASRWLKNHNNVLKLLGLGEIKGQKVTTSAGGQNIQIFGESIREYLARQGAC